MASLYHAVATTHLRCRHACAEQKGGSVMCAINLWAVNAAAFTPTFQEFTAQRLGIAPAIDERGIGSSLVRGSSCVFTLTKRMCDCDSLIGRGAEPAHDDEVDAQSWLDWLRELPDAVPYLSRIAVLRAWSPQGDVISPVSSRSIGIDELDEASLRVIRDDMLLTIDYSHAS